MRYLWMLLFAACLAPCLNGNDEPEYTPQNVADVKHVMDNQNNLYIAFGLQESATEAEIKKAFRTWSLKLHPDKNKAPGADEAMKVLNRAKDVLMDAEKRKSYKPGGKGILQVRQHTRTQGSSTTPAPKEEVTEAPDLNPWKRKDNLNVAEDEKNLAKTFFDDFDKDNILTDKEKEKEVVILNIPEKVDFFAKFPDTVDAMLSADLYQKVDEDIKKEDYNRLLWKDNLDILKQVTLSYNSIDNYYLVGRQFLNQNWRVKIKIFPLQESGMTRLGDVRVTIDNFQSYVAEQTVNHLKTLEYFGWNDQCFETQSSARSNFDLPNPIGSICTRSLGIMKEKTGKTFKTISCIEVYFRLHDFGVALCSKITEATPGNVDRKLERYKKEFKTLYNDGKFVRNGETKVSKYGLDTTVVTNAAKEVKIFFVINNGFK